MNSAITTPTLSQWLLSYEKFRRGLDRLGSMWKNDTVFCKAHKLSRAQFWRVMKGKEKPSLRVITVLARVLPELYEQEKHIWARAHKIAELPKGLVDLDRNMSEEDARLLLETILLWQSKGRKLTVRAALILLASDSANGPSSI